MPKIQTHVRSISLLSRLMKANDDFHHASGLCQEAEDVQVSEAGLLQEFLTNNLCQLQGAFLIFRHGVHTNKLRDFLQVRIFLRISFIICWII